MGGIDVRNQNKGKKREAIKTNSQEKDITCSHTS
jgi:hypothetical protein